MKLFNKQTIALLICVIAINVLCVTSVSYAYFTAKINGNESAEPMAVTAGKMKIIYTDSSEVSLNSAIPGDSVTKQFKVQSTGNLATSYNIKLNIAGNTFGENDLKVTLKKKTGTGDFSPVIEGKVLPTSSGYILKNQELAVDGLDTYELTISFNNEEGNQQATDDTGNIIEKTMTLNVAVDSEHDVELVPGY